MAKLETALEQISKDLKLTISTLNDQKYEAAIRLSSGSLCLDLALGGGYAAGRVHELFGAEACGKSMLSLFAIAEAQKSGMVAALVDAERCFNPPWASGFGVDSDKLIYTEPDCGEQALEAVDRLANTGKVHLIVVDSIAGLVPKAEIDGAIGDIVVGAQARLMSHALRKLVATISRTQTCLLFINQLRHKIGIMFGSPETTPGGLALRYYASIRLDARRQAKSERYDESKRIVGHDIRIKVVKNKTAYPFRETVVPIHYTRGLLLVEDTCAAAQQVGLLTVGSVVEYAGHVSGLQQKYRAMLDFQDAIAEKGECLAALRQEVRETAGLSVRAE